VKKLPDLLKHNAILSHWSSYPEGSVQRAKSIGIELLATFTSLEVTEELWESELDIVAKEQAWKPLGLKSREEFVRAVTGRTETAVRKTLRKVAPSGRPSKGTKLVPLSKGGNDRIKAQIATRRPDVAERMEAGEFPSVRQAAIAAGIVKVASVLEQLRKVWAKATEADRRTFMDEVRDGR